MAIKAVIFDLDGTLLDTLEDLADSMNAVLLRNHFPIHSVSLYKAFVGEGVEFLVGLALPPDERGEARIRQCVGQMREEYQQRSHRKTKPYPGISELLDVLSEKKIKMAILSNKPDDFTQVIVKHFLPLWAFDVVIGSSERFGKKPDPEAAREIARILSLWPDEFIFLGDTKIDMQTARQAKMKAVGALWGFRSREELLEHGAETLIENPMQLIEHIST